jgi:WD40 repeat protein
MVRFDAMARSCTYTPDGSKIVVGLGGKVNHPHVKKGKKDGAYVVLLETDLTIFHEARDSKQWIAAVQVSPDGETIAIGSKDHYIYLYNMDDFASKGKCKGHPGGLRQLDFSGDNQVLQSTCEGNELLFFNAGTGEPLKHPTSLKDSEWDTQTCVFGWNVQGAYVRMSMYLVS